MNIVSSSSGGAIYASNSVFLMKFESDRFIKCSTINQPYGSIYANGKESKAKRLCFLFSSSGKSLYSTGTFKIPSNSYNPNEYNESLIFFSSPLNDGTYNTIIFFYGIQKCILNNYSHCHQVYSQVLDNEQYYPGSLIEKKIML